MKIALLLALVLGASSATAGPDFKTPMPRGKALAASMGTAELMPQDDVVFEHASTLLSDSAMTQLDTAAKWLRARPRLRVVLDGYADALGSDAYNEDLATRRVQAVRAHLVRRGVASDRIVLVVWGERFADPDLSPLDRRVIASVTTLPVERIVRGSLDRAAILALWTHKNAAFSETRGAHGVTSLATR